MLSNEELAPGYLREKELSDLTETHTNISTAFFNDQWTGFSAADSIWGA